MAKNNYIFPDLLGDFMKKVDMKTQLEASMLSMTLMLIGLIITGIYVVLYLNFPLWYKIVLVVNILAGLLFMISFLTTTFQQYQSYLEAIEFQSISSNSSGTLEKVANDFIKEVENEE